MGATFPQVTEGERRRRREVTSPKSQCMEGTASRNSWRGLSDTHLHPSRFLLSSKPVSITLRIKCQFSRLAFGAGPERDSGNLSGLICSPKCVYYHLSPCLCPSRAPSAYNYIPSSPIGTSGLPHDGPSLRASLVDPELGVFASPGVLGASLPAPSSLGSPSHCLASVPPDIPTMPRCRPAPPGPPP